MHAMLPKIIEVHPCVGVDIDGETSPNEARNSGEAIPVQVVADPEVSLIIRGLLSFRHRLYYDNAGAPRVKPGRTNATTGRATVTSSSGAVVEIDRACALTRGLRCLLRAIDVLRGSVCAIRF
jgi:hypothetical protein